MSFKFPIQFLIPVLLFHFSSGVHAQSDSSGRPVNTFSRSYGRTGLLFDTGVYLGQTEATANPAVLNQWQSTTSIYDFKLGYITEGSFYYGAEYSVRSDNQVSSHSTDGEAASVGIGFFSDKGLNVRTFYNFNNSFGNYTNGSGFKVDFGYMKSLTANFFLGFSVSYRQTTFKTNTAIVAFDSWTRKETYPFLNLGLIFN